MMLAKSLQSAAGNAAAEAVYIEDVMSTFLYTGNGSTQTITNGIDLAGEGGLVWIKNRAVSNNAIIDTVRTRSKVIFANTTAAEVTSGSTNDLTSFNGDGFSVGTTSNASVNSNGASYVSWTFRKQEKFFDCVTYTGDGAFSQQINHNLGSTPGFILIKRTNTTGDWAVAARISDGTYAELKLNTTGANLGNFSPSATATSVVVGENWATTSPINASGSSYVMYLFAHNAGGFGLSGTDNVISCGSYTGTGAAGNAINLGYEPQWLLVKNATTGGQNWEMFDNMRGVATGGIASELFPNTSSAERNAFKIFNFNATGFETESTLDETNASGNTYIYIAIRRGPMKVPESGTSVFSPNAYTGTGAVLPITGMGFPPDFLLTKQRAGGNDWCVQDKLRGPSQFLSTDTTGAELNLGTAQLVSIDQNGVTYGNGSSFVNFNGATYINLSFRRAPGFFDEVCYTTGAGTGITTFNHNLGVVPELVISRTRNAADDWYVYAAPRGTSKTIYLNYNLAEQSFTCADSLSSTQATTYVGVGSAPAVSYLFATCPGVSKVGSYTGTGTTQTINCGFIGGARFVMIKRTDSTGDWYAWDSARGIVAGNDSYLTLNTTAAEVTTTDWVDTYSAGFELSNSAGNNVNINGASYIFLSVA